MAFETTDLNLGAFTLIGQMTNVAATDDIMRDDEAFDITIEWHVEGSALDPSSALGLKPGEWKATAHLESIGSAAGEHDLGPATIRWDAGTFDPALLRYSYSVTIPVTAGFLSSGLYKLAAAVTYTLDSTGGPARMAGFVEGVVFQVYDAP